MLKQIPMIFLVAKVIILFVCASLHSCNSEGRTNLPKIVSVPALITFGDSFVDQGNNNYIAALGKSNHPPYGKDFVGGKATGRFSNGKTLADFFAEGLGVKEYLQAYLDPSIQDNDLLSGVSFASGGSGYDPVTPKISLAIPLWDQLDLFKQYIGRLEMNVGQEEATKIITNSVFLVVASTNDLIVAYPIIRRSEYDVPTYNSILLNLTLSFVQELYELGARKIGVFGAPPVGCFPAERTLFGGLPERMCVDDRNEAAQLYNSMLEEQLPILASNLPQSRVAFVDFYNPLISAIDNPQQYGIH